MKRIFILLSILLPVSLSGQKQVSAVEFSGYKSQILIARKDAMKATGKLSTGEPMTIGCDQGSCYFEINYKGRMVRQQIGSEIGILSIYGFDFSGDGDFEIVAVNDYRATSSLLIFSYSRGMIQKLFEKEIKSNKVMIKKDYLEYNSPEGGQELWNFYQGQFWKMTPYKNE